MAPPPASCCDRIKRQEGAAQHGGTPGTDQGREPLLCAHAVPTLLLMAKSVAPHYGVRPTPASGSTGG
jgi:hypothetical protein